jgi:hypothetical protein
MGGTRCTHGRNDKCLQYFSQETTHGEIALETFVHGMILIRGSKKLCVKKWTLFKWLSIVSLNMLLKLRFSEKQ